MVWTIEDPCPSAAIHWQPEPIAAFRPASTDFPLNVATSCGVNIWHCGLLAGSPLSSPLKVEASSRHHLAVQVMACRTRPRANMQP
jgi:hypothetical protein